MPIVPPTLAVADQKNGGGLVATLTGGDPGASNVVYYAEFSGRFGAMDGWNGVGSRLGPGTVSGTTGRPGYFVWYVVSALGSETAAGVPVYQNLTAALTAPHDDLIDAAVARTLLLALPGIAEVKRKAVPDDGATPGNITFPCLQFSDLDESETDAGGTNAHDDVGYPIKAWLLRAQDFNPAKDKTFLYCRWRLARAFRSQPLGAAHTCKIEYGPVKSQAARGPGGTDVFFASMLTLRFIVREARGLTA